jgi:CDP-diglyceride synthetase
MKLRKPQYKISRKNSIKDFLWGLFFLGFAALIVCHFLNDMGWSTGGLLDFAWLCSRIGGLFLFSYLGYQVCLKGAINEWKEYKKQRQDYEIHLENKGD